MPEQPEQSTSEHGTGNIGGRKSNQKGGGPRKGLLACTFPPACLPYIDGSAVHTLARRPNRPLAPGSQACLPPTTPPARISWCSLHLTHARVPQSRTQPRTGQESLNQPFIEVVWGGEV